MDEPRRIFSIGHSNHELAHFLALLNQHAIEVIADTRSNPVSGYAVQFDREPLQRALNAAGVQYVYLGRELGGRPSGDQFYDDEGYVLYDRVAASSRFQEGLQRVEAGLERFRVALLCAEEDPSGCHRRLLVGRVLTQRGIQVVHVRGDGRTQTESQLVEKERLARTRGQEFLFEVEKEEPWRSIRSVLPKKAQPSSSQP